MARQKYSLIDDPQKKKKYSLINENEGSHINNQDEIDFYKNHPFIKALGEHLGKIPGLSTAARYAQGTINEPIEAIGLPHAARGFIQGGENLIRGVGNLIPGINIPSSHFNEMPIGNGENNILQQLMGYGGEAASIGGPAMKIAQGTNKALWTFKIPSYLQKILSGSTAGAIVSPDSRKEGALLGGAVSSLPELSKPIQKISNKVKSLLPKNPFEAIQQGYDKKLNQFGSMFEEASKEAKQAGVDKIPLHADLIKQVKELGPKSKEFTSLLDKAKNGDYDAVRKLQTELFHRGTSYKNSLLPSDRDYGDLILEARDEINDTLHSHLRANGLDSTADKLQEAMAGWKDLINTYHSNNLISKLVGNNREVPDSLKVLKKEAVDINKLKKAHPEIQKMLDFEKKKMMAGGALGALGIGGGIKKLYNDFIG